MRNFEISGNTKKIKGEDGSGGDQFKKHDIG